MHIIPPIKPSIQRARSRTATAAVEFALLAPLFLILLTGTFELGMAAFQILQVESAAEAGALYAAKHGISNIANISAAVTNASSVAGITASPAPLVACGCPTASGITFQGSNCTTACAGGVTPGQYVTVSAALTRTAVLLTPYLALPLPATLTATAIVRVR